MVIINPFRKLVACAGEENRAACNTGRDVRLMWDRHSTGFRNILPQPPMECQFGRSASPFICTRMPSQSASMCMAQSSATVCIMSQSVSMYVDNLAVQGLQKSQHV